MITIFLRIYSLVWKLALPFLRRARRTSFGWQERTLAKAPEGPFDLWIQAASGGESMLTNMVLDELNQTLESKFKINILATSGTKEGVDSLKKAKEKRNTSCFELQIAYFPFDAPFLMEKAFNRFAPRLAVIVETELWPAFLVYAQKKGVPVFLINGRMSDKSCGSYKRFSSFFHAYGPDRTWAISELDQARLAGVMGTEKVGLMNNIKFDRITPIKNSQPDVKLQSLLPADQPFILLGSIRREEEDKILKTVKELLTRRSDITVGIFPKHIDRAEVWQDKLQQLNIVTCRRSHIREDTPPAAVIIWDVFGELALAYQLAKVAFVGGSLVNLGGQNFLEPLVFGLRPIIGPYWRNFAWVGREIVTSGLVIEVADENMLTSTILKQLDDQEDKDRILEQVQEYFDPKKGGTRFVCQKITEKLHAL